MTELLVRSLPGRGGLRWLALVVAVTVVAGEVSAGDCISGPSRRLAQSELVVESGAQAHRLTVELARSEEERARGLMCRERLAADSGMLFDFGRDQPVAMWMKNTLIPLDMVFIHADGTIAHIAERTVPHSLATISPRQPIRFVLELNAGATARLGIKAGDRVVHPLVGR
ncbi:MAG: DUF192 domain-containing protein [Alphaproteobacteria bacterium]